MDALSLLMIIGPALLVIAMPYFLIYSFFRLGLKSDKPGIKRWTGSALFVVVVGLIFYGDILFSSVQLARLCHTKAGVYVYKRVMVPDEMWDFEKNRVKGEYIINSFALDERVNERFVIDNQSSTEHWGVKTMRLFYYDYETNNVLIDQVTFSAGAGWFAKSIPFASAPNRRCSTEQALARRFLTDGIDNDIKEKIFSEYEFENARNYSIHPQSYRK